MKTFRNNHRAAFTLIELLMVVSIIAVLSSLALVVIRDAQDTARHARSTMLVAQIQSVLQAKVEEFETRQAPFQLNAITSDWSEKRNLRRWLMLEWLRSEIPHDKRQALIISPHPRVQSYGAWGVSFFNYLKLNYPNWTSGYRKIASQMAGLGSNSDPKKVSAKFLHAILNSTWHNDSKAIDLCRPGEILADLIDVLDSNGNLLYRADGLKYVCDAFGEPIQVEIFVTDNNGVKRLLEDVVESAPAILPETPEISISVYYLRQRER